MSSNYYYCPPLERGKVRPPMDISRFMGLMVPGRNQTWPNSCRFANKRVNIDKVHAETVTEDIHEYMSTTGGSLKRWWYIDSRGAFDCPTTGHCDMPWIRCCKEVGYQRCLDALVAPATSRDTDLTPHLDLACLASLTTIIGLNRAIITFTVI